MMPMPNAPASPMPAPAGPEGGAPASPEGGDIRAMLVKILQKVMDQARSSGIDFNELVEEVAGGGMESESAAPMPRPPSPAAMPQM